MFTYEFVLATMLIQPGQTTISRDANAPLLPWLPIMENTIHALVLDEELIDARERSFFGFGDPDTALDYFGILVSRSYDRLGHPKIAETNQFPLPLNVINDYIKLNERYVERLRLHLALCPVHREAIQQVIDENAQYHRLWTMLAAAKYTGYYIDYRRTNLHTLRGLLGNEDFYAGRMPPPYTYWLFQKMKP